MRKVKWFVLSPSKLIVEPESSVLSTFLLDCRSNVSDYDFAFFSASSWSPFLGNIYWILYFISHAHTYSVNAFSPHNWPVSSLFSLCPTHWPCWSSSGCLPVCDESCPLAPTSFSLPGPSSTPMPSHCRIFNLSLFTASKSYPTCSKSLSTLNKNQKTFSPPSLLSFLSQPSCESIVYTCNLSFFHVLSTLR